MSEKDDAVKVLLKQIVDGIDLLYSLQRAAIAPALKSQGEDSDAFREFKKVDDRYRDWLGKVIHNHRL